MAGLKQIAMKNLIMICLLLLSCEAASAQHDLYKWQLSGYTGTANYINEDNSSSDYFKVNNNLLHRLELTRSIGNSLGLSVGYSLGEVRGRDLQRNPFTTDVHMSALRAYLYTDNGWIFNVSARLSPYFFGGYGLSVLETTMGAATEKSRYVSAIPFGIGLKFRLAERWQLALQTEAVYLADPHLKGAALEQNDYNSTYMHTGFTLGYSFGFRKSSFKAPRFYSNNVALLQSVEGQNQPRQNVLEAMLKLEPMEVQLINTEDTVNLATLQEITQRAVYAPGDTLNTRSTVVEADSSTQAQIGRHRLVPAEPTQAQDTTSSIQTISSAGTRIRRDSVVVRNDVREVQAAPAVVQQSAVSTDTVRQQPAVAAQQRVQKQQTITAPGAAPVKTEHRAPARTLETTRVKERNVYVPTNTKPAPAQRTGVDTARLREERQRLAFVNAENRRLQGRIDSLQAAPAGDTLRTGTAAVADTSMLRYLQQQAALNDSMLQRLNQYEQELALSNSPSAAPASAPAELAPEVAPESYTTTVFYPINAYRVPTGSLRDLNQVLQPLQENPGLHVKLTGYASQSGNPSYNKALSRRRVESLADFLTLQGIAKERVSMQHMGDEKASQQENPLDRKVDIEVYE
jgi:outer membrane protein OmpA-like peptidoglycan-associated protein